jgi:hypothetical protein
MYVLLGIGALFIVWEFSNRMFRIAIVLTVILFMCASQLGAGDMLHAAEQSLPEWKQFIDFQPIN